MLSRRVLYCLFLLLLSACRNTSDRPATYFDVLVDNEVKHLTNSGAILTKDVWMGSDKSHASFLPDSIHWKNELEVFHQLAVFDRTPVQQNYHVDSMRDSKSNLLIKRYVVIPEVRSDRHAPSISEMKFYYLKNIRNLRRIEALYHKVNILFTTSRRLVMEFEESSDSTDQPHLTAYSIIGSEKMILSDSVKFSIHAQIGSNTKKAPDSSPQ